MPTVGSKFKQRSAVMDGSIVHGKTQPTPDGYERARVQAKAFQRQKLPVPSMIQKIIDAHNSKVIAAKAASEAEAAVRREAKALSRKAEIVKSESEDWLERTFGGEGVALLSPGAFVAINAERFRDLPAAASASAAATRASARSLHEGTN